MNGEFITELDELMDLEKQMLTKVQKYMEKIPSDLSRKNLTAVQVGLNEVECNIKRNIDNLNRIKDVCEGKTDQVTEIKNVTDIWNIVR